MNGSDPLGLDVCFEGSRAEVDSLKSAAEEATNTTLTLDSRNCVKSVHPNRPDDSLTELGQRLSQMAADPTVYYTVALWPTLSGRQPAGVSYSFGRQGGAAMLGQYNSLQYPTGPWASCDGGWANVEMAQMLTHELLGHLYQAYTAQDFSNERKAIDEAERHYLVGKAKAARCSHEARAR